MEWKKFNELSIEYPEKVVQSRIQGFDVATDNLANLELFKANGVKALSIDLPGTFKFALYLTSQALNNYRFEILSFSYDIKFTPIYLSIEESIDEELFGENYGFEKRTHTVNSVEELKRFLDSIFASKVFETIVGGIIKVAKNDW